MHKNGLF